MTDTRSLEHIRERILNYTEIDVKHKSKKRVYVYARMIFTKIMREEFLHTYEKIGDFLNRSHCAMLYSYNSFETIEKYEPKFYKTYKLILTELEQEDLIIRSKIFGAMEDEQQIIKIRDIIKDTINNIKPEYEAYIN